MSGNSGIIMYMYMYVYCEQSYMYMYNVMYSVHVQCTTTCILYNTCT